MNNLLKNQQLIIGVLVAVIVAGASFFGGMKYQQSKMGMGFNMMGRGGNRAQFMNGQNRFGMGMGGAVIGEIIAADDKSITVKMDDGSSKIVLFSDSVVVSKTDTGSKSDLKTGAKVGVFGTQNSDGTISAANIQLNPMFRMGRGMMPSQSTPSAK